MFDTRNVIAETLAIIGAMFRDARNCSRALKRVGHDQPQP